MNERTEIENSCKELSDCTVSKNNCGFKFSFDPLATTRPTLVSYPVMNTTTSLHFNSQDELGKLFTLQDATTLSTINGDQTSLTSTQLSTQPFLNKITRPTPPSLNTININQLMLANSGRGGGDGGSSNSNVNTNCGNNFCNSSNQQQVDNLDEPVLVSGHSRRDSNGSSMSIQLHDIVGSGHHRRDSNVSNASMQLDIPTPSSEIESGNEDESKFSFFPFTLPQKSLSLSS
ncbi:10289_t:CDS:2, partial [Entrophospora sp. SA101]